MYKDARSTALKILETAVKYPEINVSKEIVIAVEKASYAFPLSNEETALLIEDLRKSLNITMTMKSVLKNHIDTEHIPWLKTKSLDWKHWNRFRRYLYEVKEWPVNVINSLDDTSESVLELLEDPTVQGRKYDRRGLVVGYVQSGKTANYTALINKAFDAGWKLVVVLAGMHNDLRSQTQLRLDEEVLGYETSKDSLLSDEKQNNAIGVGALLGETFFEVFSLTTRDHHGDFNTKTANVSIQPSKQQLLLVVKKHAGVLELLKDYFRERSPLARYASPDAKHKTVPNIPLLLIDDEADQATVNTKNIFKDNGELDPNYKPSTINGLIRDIYHTFEQKSYIGYTATPFANIFINKDATTDAHDEELFPKDFIIGLPKPSNYVGPAELFGLDSEDENDGGLPLIMPITHNNSFIPQQHNKEHVPTRLPDSLLEAIYSFLIATVYRRLRGQRNVHNSMLVHVTTFKDVQKVVYNLILDLIRDIKDDLKYSQGEGVHYKGIRDLFMTKYSSEKLTRLRLIYGDKFDSDLDGGLLFDVAWEDVLKELLSVVDSVKTKMLNGNSKDVLDYKEHKDSGLNVIAIGGNKLSRGLTLEGLTVSYYLRASSNYDTLMQMGRWFGYRPGYLDLCRIYTTKDLASWFKHIAVATEELMGQIEYMSEIGATPSQFLLKVKSHPEMYITSLLKMRSAKEIKVSYSAELVQTTVFPTTSYDFFNRNYLAVENLVSILRDRSYPSASPDMEISDKKHYCWTRVDGNLIADFLHAYQTVSSASRANSGSLAEYVRKRINGKELREWTVVLINNGGNDFNIAGISIGEGVSRTGIENYSKDGYTSIKTLTSRGHEFLDMSRQNYQKALSVIQSADKDRKSKVAASKKARELRDPNNGLLVIYPIVHEKLDAFQRTEGTKPLGFAISFPPSTSTDTEVDYVVNKSVDEGGDMYWDELG